MDYKETIDYLFTRLPMFSRIGAAAFRKDLDNIVILCDHLGNPQKKFKSIHIAGTNGKGSSSHMLAAIMQENGYNTGLYTSPHLRDFRERIKVNGHFPEEEYIISFVEHLRPLIEKIEPSFFEITVAMAFDYFAKKAVDIAVVEVGLGGRLDSTNIIIPELSVITNISYDHMNMLGDTLEEIAYEKAGIIKPAVPAVVGEWQEKTAPVFIKKAAETGSDLQFASRKYYVSDWQQTKQKIEVEVGRIGTDEKERYILDLPGIYQTKNLLTVLEAVQQLRSLGWNIKEEAVHKALQQVKKRTGLHGRWEMVHDHPAIYLDVAHNEDGLRQVNRQIELTDHENLHIVIGLVKDKDFRKIFDQLPAQASYYFTRAHIPRALPENELARAANAAGLSGNHYPDVNSAVQAAISHAGSKDLIIVCGSVFIVAELTLDLSQAE